MDAADSGSLSERKTRRDLIDPKLAAAGWRVVPFDEEKPLTEYSSRAVCEYPTDNDPADYALYASGKVLGIELVPVLSDPGGRGRANRDSNDRAG